MKLGQLKEFDQSFQIEHGDSEFQIQGITDNHNLSLGHLVFIKNKNFLNIWLDRQGEIPQTGLIVEKKFYLFEMMNNNDKGSNKTQPVEARKINFGVVAHIMII